MANLAKLRQQQNQVNDSLAKISENVLETSVSAVGVLSACIANIGRIFQCQVIHAYLTNHELKKFLTRKVESEDIPDNDQLKKICHWPSEVEDSYDITDENAKLLQRKILVSSEYISIPLIKKITKDEKQPSTENNSILTSYDFPALESENDDQYMSIGVILILKSKPLSKSANAATSLLRRQSAVVPLPYTSISDREVALLRHIGLMASVGLKHVRMFHKIERDEFTSSINHSIIEHLSCPSVDEVLKVKGSFQLYLQESQEKLKTSLLLSPSFPALKYTEDDLVIQTVRMFQSVISHDLSNDDVYSISKFALSVKKSYRQVSYHNWRHGFNVSQALYWLVSDTEIAYLLTEEEKVALLIATLCHDLDHRGCNNNYQKNNETELYFCYSTSVMERHHLERTFQLLDIEENKMFLKKYDMESLKTDIEHAIIASDLSLYFKRKPQIAELAEKFESDAKYRVIF